MSVWKFWDICGSTALLITSRDRGYTQEPDIGNRSVFNVSVPVFNSFTSQISLSVIYNLFLYGDQAGG